MPKLKRNEISTSEYGRGYEDFEASEYEHLVKYLQSTFGIPLSMIEYHPCAGAESLFLRFRGKSFWLFEIDEEQNYTEQEWYDYVQGRLNGAYLQMEELMELNNSH